MRGGPRVREGAGPGGGERALVDAVHVAVGWRFGLGGGGHPPVSVMMDRLHVFDRGIIRFLNDEIAASSMIVSVPWTGKL